MTAISLRRVNVTLGAGNDSFCLPELNLDVYQGEFIAVVGPSGVGKSTLLRVVAGLEPIESGQILIDEKRVDRLPSADRNLAMVFQNYALYPHMTVAQNIGFSQKLKGITRKASQTKVLDVAKRLKVDNLLNSLPAQLSGGQKQRVAIGRAMMCEPSVFLFDEPFSNLDPALRAHMRLELKALHQSLGTTSIFVTHDQQESMALADRIILMSPRGIEQIDTPQNIFTRPVNLYTAQFFGEPQLNLFDALVTTTGLQLSANYTVPWHGPKSLLDTHVTVGVRPRAFKYDNKDGMAMQVTLIEYLGDECYMYLHCLHDKSQNIVVVGLHQLLVGQVVCLSVASQKLMVFDQNQQRIDPVN
ncbi:MAG: ABC-type sugar transport system ATPase subunit [Paraglaciecola sp.]|jgi:ABC-type sugar transport system ATPase subunit